MNAEDSIFDFPRYDDDDFDIDDEDEETGAPFMQNRELSWLTFNERVLDQGADESVPLLDRLNFISIFWSNLQEFFMVRVGSLTDLSFIEPPVIDSKTGMNADEQIQAIHERCHELYPIQESYYEHVRGSLAKQGVRHLRPEDLSDEQRNYLFGLVRHNIEPFLSPQIINSRHPFPHIENGKLYILVRLDDEAEPIERKKKKKEKGKKKDKGGAEGVLLGLIPLPHQCERVIKLPGRGFQYILLEHAIEMFVPEIFSMYKIKHTNVICVTRNADFDANQGFDEQDEDYREHMKRLLKQRARLAPVRLECERPLSPVMEKLMLKKLGLKRFQVYDTIVPLDLSYTWGLGSKLSENKRAKLTATPFTPAWPTCFDRSRRIIDQVAERETLMFYPFESMDPFVQLLREASNDPDVVSIKITLYRLASQSHLAEALIAAADNGKEVTALFELRARFDENNNIEWSQRFEEAGCKVIYGFRDYKVHSKICCITRRMPDGSLQHITQLGTGNYNEKTARLYTDLSFITTSEDFGRDAVEFFKNMQLENVSDNYQMLRVAPLQIKTMILNGLDGQIARARSGLSATAFMKANSITDKEVIEKISEASNAGVKITLFIRGICCLVPRLKGATENVRVVSIVGRLLEHSRIYCFGDGDDAVVYLSSADLMTRNLNKRVEIAWPILDMALKRRILMYIDICLHDTAKLRELRANRTYTPLGAFCDIDEEGNPRPAFDAQNTLIAQAAEAAEEMAQYASVQQGAANAGGVQESLPVEDAQPAVAAVAADAHDVEAAPVADSGVVEGFAPTTDSGAAPAGFGAPTLDFGDAPDAGTAGGFAPAAGFSVPDTGFGTAPGAGATAGFAAAADSGAAPGFGAPTLDFGSASASAEPTAPEVAMGPYGELELIHMDAPHLDFDDVPGLASSNGPALTPEQVPLSATAPGVPGPEPFAVAQTQADMSQGHIDFTQAAAPQPEIPQPDTVQQQPFPVEQPQAQFESPQAQFQGQLGSTQTPYQPAQQEAFGMNIMEGAIDENLAEQVPTGAEIAQAETAPTPEPDLPPMPDGAVEPTVSGLILTDSVPAETSFDTSTAGTQNFEFAPQQAFVQQDQIQPGFAQPFQDQQIPGNEFQSQQVPEQSFQAQVQFDQPQQMPEQAFQLQQTSEQVFQQQMPEQSFLAHQMPDPALQQQMPVQFDQQQQAQVQFEQPGQMQVQFDQLQQTPEPTFQPQQAQVHIDQQQFIEEPFQSQPIAAQTFSPQQFPGQFEQSQQVIEQAFQFQPQQMAAQAFQQQPMPEQASQQQMPAQTSQPQQMAAQAFQQQPMPKQALQTHPTPDQAFQPQQQVQMQAELPFQMPAQTFDGQQAAEQPFAAQQVDAIAFQQQPVAQQPQPQQATNQTAEQAFQQLTDMSIDEIIPQEPQQQESTLTGAGLQALPTTADQADAAADSFFSQQARDIEIPTEKDKFGLFGRKK